ncbi:MAG: ABC transporter ATP-binding protein [Campylobacterales bacterium]|nr:ABC transporter ATP-binding protein [Campylobacterales bacterium]
MYQFCIEKLEISTNNTNIVKINNLDITESLALVGQSGSGKSLTLKSIIDMIPSTLHVEKKINSNFVLNSQNISLIPQNPFTSLSPMTKIYKHFIDPNGKLLDNTDELLQMVDLQPSLKERFSIHLSGGQLQRIVIAIALSNNPKLLLLDEPTTALDQQTTNTILQLLQNLQKQLDFLMIYVSHDINSIQSTCKKIAIMNKGKICEYGDTLEILKNPQHPYTKTLIESEFKNRSFRQ